MGCLLLRGQGRRERLWGLWGCERGLLGRGGNLTQEHFEGLCCGCLTCGFFWMLLEEYVFWDCNVTLPILTASLSDRG